MQIEEGNKEKWINATFTGIKPIIVLSKIQQSEARVINEKIEVSIEISQR